MNRREEGFTLVEMIIALLLASMLLTAIVRLMMSTFDSANKNQSASKAQLDRTAAVRQLSEDLRRMASPVRTGDYTFNQDDFRAWMLHQTATLQAYDSAGTPRVFSTPEVLDISLATPTNLWFKADVHANTAGVECVRYDVTVPVAGGPVKPVLKRTVATVTPTCAGGATLVTTQLLEMGATGAAAAPFSYFFSPLTVSELDAYNSPGPGRCAANQSFPPTALPGGDGRRIVGVKVDAKSVVDRQDRDDLSASSQQLQVDLPTHAAGEYQNALGCSL